MPEKPKTNKEWLEESKDHPHILKIKLSVLGQIAINQSKKAKEQL